MKQIMHAVIQIQCPTHNNRYCVPKPHNWSGSRLEYDSTYNNVNIKAVIAIWRCMQALKFKRGMIAIWRCTPGFLILNRVVGNFSALDDHTELYAITWTVHHGLHGAYRESMSIFFWFIVSSSWSCAPKSGQYQPVKEVHICYVYSVCLLSIVVDMSMVHSESDGFACLLRRSMKTTYTTASVNWFDNWFSGRWSLVMHR